MCSFWIFWQSGFSAICGFAISLFTDNTLALVQCPTGGAEVMGEGPESPELCLLQGLKEGNVNEKSERMLEMAEVGGFRGTKQLLINCGPRVRSGGFYRLNKDWFFFPLNPLEVCLGYSVSLSFSFSSFFPLLLPRLLFLLVFAKLREVLPAPHPYRLRLASSSDNSVCTCLLTPCFL